MNLKKIVMLIIHHNRDFDGIASGAILKDRYPDARVMGYHYGEPFSLDSFEHGEAVVMADVSMPMEVMGQIAEKSGDFTWIDHHVSAFNDFKEYFPNHHVDDEGLIIELDGGFTYLYENGRAACELCWEYYFGTEVPIGVLLLGRYDTWRQGEGDWNGETLPFQMGMRLWPLDVESFPIHFMESDSDCRGVIEKGLSVMKYQELQCEKQLEIGKFEATLDGLRAICCAGVPFNSQSFASVWDEGRYDLMVPVSWSPSGWSMSLYTTKPEIDCSVIAKRYGGGGHRQAAGMKVDDIRDVLDID